MTSLERIAALVRASEADIFRIAAAVALLLALGAAAGAFVYLRRKRLIEDTPTARVRSAAQGYLELEGRAELMDGDPIHAPLSLRACTWYAYEIEHRERRQGSGQRGQHWATIERGTSEHLFHLVDDTGRCAIDPDGAAVRPARRHMWYGASRIPGRFHADDGAWWARALGVLSQPYRYTESRIDPGDPIYAIGEFITHGGAATAADHGPTIAERLREWKRDQSRLLARFDGDGDGRIGVEEWDAARSAAAREVTAEQDHGGAPPPVDVLARPRDRRRPFIIAAGSEHALLARYRLTSAALLALALPLLCATVWAIALRLS